MVTLANTEIREAAKRNGVRLWQVAEGIGISDAPFPGSCAGSCLPVSGSGS